MTTYFDGKVVARGYLDKPVQFVYSHAASTRNTTRNTTRNMLFIGKRNSSPGPMLRHLQGLRIVVGLAVYKGGFQPMKYEFVGNITRETVTEPLPSNRFGNIMHSVMYD